MKKDKEISKKKKTNTAATSSGRTRKKPAVSAGKGTREAKKKVATKKPTLRKRQIAATIHKTESSSQKISPPDTSLTKEVSSISQEKEPEVIKPTLPTEEPRAEAINVSPATATHLMATEIKGETKPPLQKPRQETDITTPSNIAAVTITLPVQEKAEVPSSIESGRQIEIDLPISIKDLAVKIQEKPSVIIKALMEKKMMVTINHLLEEETVLWLGERFNFKIKKAPTLEETIIQEHKKPDLPQELQKRPPVVTLMGHVDHGKTSLLDAIRQSNVAQKEYGGITQHIGAYRVILPQGEITFLDTPGHEAFTAMRARGARVTDIVVLVVAADDGVMPQTKEAIDHAQAAGVSIIVAINKIDKPQANIDRVKKQLAELGLAAEDWGGKTITVPVSAKTGQGIQDLLEMILLEAEMLELKANPNRLARGVVIEAKLSSDRGPVATLLVQNGTLRLNQSVLVGEHYGRIRAMFDDHGRGVVLAGPSFPVEVLGLSGVPEAGEEFIVTEEEKIAKEIAMRRRQERQQRQISQRKIITLDDLHNQIKKGDTKEVNLILKADVQGSLEAVKNALSKIDTKQIRLNVLHDGIGNINYSDAILAVASGALIMGFNVDIDEKAKEVAEREQIDIRVYTVIYELVNEIKLALEGMLEPKTKTIFLGRAEVRKVFRLSRAGTVAGCFVSKGKIMRSANVKLVRNGQLVFGGKISSLKRFKDDVREVLEGFECGISLEGFSDFQEGDVIEAYQLQKVARKLES